MTAEAPSTPTTNKKVVTGAGAAAVAAAILAAVVSLEGGYVNNPKDPGGETNHGITKSVARSEGYDGNMKDLTADQAKAIYRKKYITEPGFEPFLTLAPAVAEELVDTGVNVGPARPSRWLQVSLNALNRGGQDYPDISVDGKVGAGTIKAYEGLVKKRGRVKACQLVIKLLDAQQAQHYLGLTSLETFTPGWVDHRLGNVPLSRCN